MDAVVNLCGELHWQRQPDLKSDYLKPVCQRGRWRVLIGKLWTTIWRCEKETVYEMHSLKTEADFEKIESELRTLTEKTKR